MSRVFSLCALTVLGAILVGCGKKDDSESSGGSSSGSGSGGDGQVLLRARTDDDKREAVAKLRRIGLALHSAHDAYQTFPAGVVGPKGQLGLSWRVALLPYLDELALYKELKLDEPWDSEHNKKLLTKMPKVFEAPGTIVGNGKTYLRSFSGPQGFLSGPPAAPKGAPTFSPWAGQPPGSYGRGRQIVSIADGTSNTLMVAEAAEPVEWTKPEDLPFSDQPGGPSGLLPKLGGLFEGGFHGLMCDGEVRFYSAALNEGKLRALITVAGGEMIHFEPSEFQTPPRERPKRPTEDHAPARPTYGSPATRK